MRRDPTRTVTAVEDPEGLADPGPSQASGDEVEGRYPPGRADREVVQAKMAANPTICPASASASMRLSPETPDRARPATRP